MDPISDGVRAQMNATADALKEVFAGYGWALLVFDWGDKGRMNYISNAQRDDMLVAMREFIAMHEGRAHDAPAQKQ